MLASIFYPSSQLESINLDLFINKQERPILSNVHFRHFPTGHERTELGMRMEHDFMFNAETSSKSNH